MADIPRLAKSGSSWGLIDLKAYNISIVEQEEQVFFGGPLPAYTGPDDFIRHENHIQGLDAESLALMKRLDLAMRIAEGEESTVDDFLTELLRVLKYETEETMTRAQKDIRFTICGQEVYAKTDVCVLDSDYRILLLAQEDKSHISLQQPEPQLVAAAIAAFQANNQKRKDRLFLDPLKEQVFPGITMLSTFPRFYKIRVTVELDDCVQCGQYPVTKTTVYRHTPRVRGRHCDGMKPLENRKHILRCYEAFRRFVLPEQGDADDQN